MNRVETVMIMPTAKSRQPPANIRTPVGVSLRSFIAFTF